LLLPQAWNSDEPRSACPALFSHPHRLAAIGDFQSEGVAALCQLDGQRLRRRRRAMFDRQSDLITVAAQVEIAVAPGVELGRAAQRLPGAFLSSALR
jgi:hypothetical protein